MSDDSLVANHDELPERAQLCLSLSVSRQLLAAITSFEGSSYVSLGQSDSDVFVDQLAGADVSLLSGLITAQGGVKQLKSYNLDGLFSLSESTSLASVYPSLRIFKSEQIETVSIEGLFPMLASYEEVDLFVDVPSETSLLVIALLREMSISIRKVDFILGEFSQFDGELPFSSVKNEAQERGFLVQTVEQDATVYGSHYSIVPDQQKRLIHRLENKLREQEARYRDRHEDDAQIVAELTEALRSADNKRDELSAKLDEQEKQAQHQFEQLAEKISQLEGAATEYVSAVMLSNKVTAKAQADLAELRVRYEERVTELGEYRELVTQLKDKLGIAAELYERLLEAPPEALRSLGIDPQ